MRAEYLYHLYLFGVITDRELVELLSRIDDEPIAVIRVAMKMIRRGENNEK